ncbi:MAG: hypothetical protein CM1200mP26_06490 [Acidimicrobiales bacterium]|nr:MAG: hypothetical protein CM1200mP26_06490 [Acidimicrobiales bacterium]
MDRFPFLSDDPAAPGRRAEWAHVWGLRSIWLLLPVLTGPAAADALNDMDAAPRSTASATLWVLWAVGLTATLVPLPLTLTALRLGGPAVAALAAWSAEATSDAVHAAFALAAGALVVLATFAAPVADRFVDGASYGDERRFLLRAPGPVALVLGPLATVVAIAGATVGPILLLESRWVAGGVVTGLGATLAAMAVRSLHRLARRWIVLVPAGFVLHDHLALAEPTLLQRAGLEHLAQHRRTPVPMTSPSTLEDWPLKSGAVGHRRPTCRCTWRS